MTYSAHKAHEKANSTIELAGQGTAAEVVESVAVSSRRRKVSLY
jgi:hypothetical protein